MEFVNNQETMGFGVNAITDENCIKRANSE